MYYVYLLTSLKFKKSYIGYTNNLFRRMTEHNNGYSNYTNLYKPWRLIYKEEYIIKKEAILREIFLKVTLEEIN